MPVKSDSGNDWVGREFSFTRDFNAPRELVFHACTDSRHLSQWWGPKGFTNPVCKWDARPGGKIYVVMRAPNGTDYPMGGEFREIMPPDRIVNTTGALDANGKLLFEILHTLTFTSTGEVTTLHMHSKVIMATESAGQFLGGFEMGMSLSLDRLTTHLSRRGEPVVVERKFDAPVATVWTALTDGAAMKQWSFDVGNFKPEVGFEFEFVAGKYDKKFRHLCRVTDVIPLKRLAYTWRYAGNVGDSLVQFELLAEGQMTRVRVTHTGLETFPKLVEFARENFVAGWTHLVGTSLKNYVEKKENTHA